MYLPNYLLVGGTDCKYTNATLPEKSFHPCSYLLLTVDATAYGDGSQVTMLKSYKSTLTATPPDLDGLAHPMTTPLEQS